MADFRFDFDPTNRPEERDRIVEESVQTRRASRERNIGLCLSGGGYRAMLFHAGTLLRINEAGLLPKIGCVSSVSGGSIIAATLGMKWSKLTFDASGVASNLLSEVVTPILHLAGITIDREAIVTGGALPLVTIGDVLEKLYARHLFKDATLQDLPPEGEAPQFVINATSVQTCVRFQFSRGCAGDYLIGHVDNPKIPLAAAVTASTAFPPVLSPMILRGLASEKWRGGTHEDAKALRARIVLTDGGVYDNLGLESVFPLYDKLIVSDGGGKTEHQIKPNEDWARHALRTALLLDEQVRNLRKRILVGAFKAKEKSGLYFSMRTQLAKLTAEPAWALTQEEATRLAETPTRLKAMDPELAQQIVNYGYTMCDLTYRTHWPGGGVKPKRLPLPEAGL